MVLRVFGTDKREQIAIKFNCGYLTNPRARQAIKYGCLVLFFSLFFAPTEVKKKSDIMIFKPDSDMVICVPGTQRRDIAP